MGVSPGPLPNATFALGGDDSRTRWCTTNDERENPGLIGKIKDKLSLQGGMGEGGPAAHRRPDMGHVNRLPPGRRW